MQTIRSTGKLRFGGSNEKMQMMREADNVQVHQMLALVAVLLVEVLQGQRNDDEGAEGRGFAAE